MHAVLFDLDGTLLDTAPDMAAALNALLVSRGKPPLPYAQARPLVSHGAGRLVRLGFPEADPTEFAELQASYLRTYRGALSVHTLLFDGMAAVLTELARRKLACGIVTNKPAWLTDPLLDELGLTGSFACVVSGDTVSERKPHAMPMLHAARLAGVDPRDCVYVGDAERDIQAGHAAGMAAVVAAYGYLEPDEWPAWNADAVIERPAELLDWLDRADVP